MGEATSAQDARFMAAAIRLSRNHLGLTGTNPSVATLIVKNGTIVGRGVTAPGGRPHAETVALSEAGQSASGATAYVTLEPCAHHGRTPPCAQALIDAGVARVVSSLTDLDSRVSGQGYAMIEAAGIELVTQQDSAKAMSVLGHYLQRTASKSAQVTLKLAVSRDGKIGRPDRAQMAVTGSVARAQSHRLRSAHDAILIGIGTALIDDPELTCRLPGLENRSPARIVLDTEARLPIASKLVQSARDVPVYVVTAAAGSPRAERLRQRGVTIIAAERHNHRVALPEMLDDLAALGMTSILVEGGARVAKAFLDEGLARDLVLFEGGVQLDETAIAAPVTRATVPDRFRHIRSLVLGPDMMHMYSRME